MLAAVLAVAAAAVACGGERDLGPREPTTETPPAPAPPRTEEIIVVKGTERLEWNQRLSDPAELGRYRFAAYVDSTRSELPGASCRATSPDTAVCVTPLPLLRPGRRVLRLVSYLASKNLDSQPSAPITLMVRPTALSPTLRERLPGERLEPPASRLTIGGP